MVGIHPWWSRAACVLLFVFGAAASFYSGKHSVPPCPVPAAPLHRREPQAKLRLRPPPPPRMLVDGPEAAVLRELPWRCRNMSASARVDASIKAGPLVWRPLHDLCCSTSRGGSHEPRGILSELMRTVGVRPGSGLFVDVGTADDMFDGTVALREGFDVLGVEPRLDSLDKVRKARASFVERGKLRLLHAVVGNASGGEVRLHRSFDSSSVVQTSITEEISGSSRKNKHLRELLKHERRRVDLVRQQTLDALVPEGVPCAAVKLDIQGYEYEALLGAHQLLSRPFPAAPLVVLEFYEHFRPDLMRLELLHLMRSYGYSCYDVASQIRSLVDGIIVPYVDHCCGGVAQRKFDPHSESLPKTLEGAVAQGTCVRRCRLLSTDFACVKHLSPPPFEVKCRSHICK